MPDYMDIADYLRVSARRSDVPSPDDLGIAHKCLYATTSLSKVLLVQPLHEPRLSCNTLAAFSHVALLPGADGNIRTIFSYRSRIQISRYPGPCCVNLSALKGARVLGRVLDATRILILKESHTQVCGTSGTTPAICKKECALAWNSALRDANGISLLFTFVCAISFRQLHLFHMNFAPNMLLWSESM